MVVSFEHVMVDLAVLMVNGHIQGSKNALLQLWEERGAFACYVYLGNTPRLITAGFPFGFKCFRREWKFTTGGDFSFPMPSFLENIG